MTDGEGFSPGGMITSSAGSGRPTWLPTTTTSTGTWTGASPVIKLVDLPMRMTKKMLIAFLDEKDDEDIVWAKKLVPIQVDISYEQSGEARMVVELSLVKTYDD